MKKGSEKHFPEFFLSEEQITNEYGSDASHRIGQQAARNGMTGLGDAHTTEVNRQYIEGGIGRTLKNASQSAHEGIGSVVGHGINHQSSGTASAQWLHESRR